MSKIDSTKFDIDGFNNATAIGPILSETYCKFKFPMKYPDKVLVGATIALGDIHADRYKLSHTVWSLKEQIVVSEG
jgi:acyl-CoA thioester hydrolase